MDDIKKRLQETTEACLKSYELWEGKKGAENRENLQDSIHELRKVASRLEITIAISEREGMSERPLPIPAHRSNSKNKGTVESILPDNGNVDGGSAGGGDKKSGGGRRQRSRRPSSNNQPSE
ncbi:MAG: hypothetical protein R3D88_02155 [Alphaproteobacteria bacterium]|nr:hypothetical protein [Alphaproteobacteria bacterium]